MDHLNKPEAADNAESTVKCPICGAMINVGGVMGAITCPVCGHNLDQEDSVLLGASNEGF